MKQTIPGVAAILILLLSFPMSVIAENDELGTPVVALMPHVQTMKDDLGLNQEQKDTLAAWVAEAPAKRKAIEAETIAVKQQLRSAILDGADRLTRENLKKELAAKRTRLIEMRALCTRMLRQTLTEEQFARVVTSYRAG